MTKKNCMLVCSSISDQGVFIRASNSVSPETNCLVASNTPDALHLMIAEDVVPDLVIIELDAPKTDAIEFLNTIKGIETLKDIDVIVHAISVQPHKILEIKESGALAIYLRPYEYDGICNMLTMYFDPEMSVFQQN